ncbi:GAF domain-containing protein [Dactylosporangium cerinum]|uniref:GAF domain-containing protein n=1 Tax=Dactylosporangium cerinum TaxID=1434730 RepID=A0ABV9W972_9ACTN
MVIDVARTAAAVRDHARLAAVAALRVTATAEPHLDELAERVRRALRVPTALLVVVEATRQVFPGASGLPERWQHSRATPLTHSFCQYVVGADAPLVVTDARRDPVLQTSDAIRDLGVIAYAGTPLHGADGHAVGALSVVDSRTRRWTASELRDLDRLAAVCSRALQARRAQHPPVRHVAARPDPPSRPDPACTGSRPADGRPWTPQHLPPGLVLDVRPPLRAGRSEIVHAGHLHGEPVAVVIRAGDDDRARQRFQRRTEVAAAFGATPPPIRVGLYRWTDGDRILVLSRLIGETLDRRHGDPPTHRFAGHDTREMSHAAALLSAWQPAGQDATRWLVDYPGELDEHHRAGRLTDDDLRRALAVLVRCGQDRTFAHGSLHAGNVLRLPSGRLGLADFSSAGIFLAGYDLATLHLNAPTDQIRHVLQRRAERSDIVETFAVNLVLATARHHGDHSHRRDRAALLRTRQHARRLLIDLTGHG